MGVPAIEYHERTNHSPASVRSDSHRLDFENKPIPYKIYEDVPRVPLADSIRPPALPALRAIAPPESLTAPRTPDLEAITQLCYYAAGITRRIIRRGNEFLFRAAACTGALYHIDLYLACGDLDGLDAGLYHFDTRTMTLDRLRTGDYRGVLAAATGDHDPLTDAPLLVVFTSTWWRNAWKYRARTYRHAFWDSGTILANLLAVAHGLDLPAAVTLGFDDGAVAALLGIDPIDEAPIALVGIGTDDPAPESPPVEPLALETRALSDRVIEYPLIQEAYEASSLTNGEAARRWRERRPDGPVGTRADRDVPHEGSGGSSDRIPLEPVSDVRASKVPIHRAITRRGSCRAYRRDSIPFRLFSTILDRAVRRVSLCVAVEAPLTFADVYLIVHDVADLQPGAYQYHPIPNSLERLRSGDFRREAGHLALDQRLAADAGACVYFLADLSAVVDQLGDRGYRAAQLEAATVAGRLYLGAYAHRDLGATGLTFYDDLVTKFFEPRAAGQTPLFLWTIGRPATD